jgi:hypothetical protein
MLFKGRSEIDSFGNVKSGVRVENEGDNIGLFIIISNGEINLTFLTT